MTEDIYRSAHEQTTLAGAKRALEMLRRDLRLEAYYNTYSTCTYIHKKK